MMSSLPSCRGENSLPIGVECVNLKFVASPAKTAENSKMSWRRHNRKEYFLPTMQTLYSPFRIIKKIRQPLLILLPCALPERHQQR